MSHSKRGKSAIASFMTVRLICGDVFVCLSYNICDAVMITGLSWVGTWARVGNKYVIETEVVMLHM